MKKSKCNEIAYEINGDIIPFRIRSSQKELLKTKLKLSTLKNVIISIIVLSIIIYGTIISYNTVKYINKVEMANTNLQEKVNKLEKYETSYKNTVQQNMILSENLKDMESIIKETDKSITKLKKDNINLSKDNKELIKKYNKLAEKVKLYEKYSYAVIDESGHRTDLTYDQIKLGEELMKEKGYDPNILFSIGMVESGFDEKETSTISTAKGYTQFLDGTAKFTWETLLKHGKGSWNPSIALNGENSIRMCVAYFDYLMKKHGNFYKAMGQYCGAGTSEGSFTYTYIDRMNRHAMRNGVNIYDIINKMN